MTAACGDVVVAVVSDGAGSASRAEAGARLACDVVLEQVERHYQLGLSAQDLSAEDVKNWFAILATRVKVLAKEEGHETRDYASTLLAAMVEEKAAAFLQVGDGAIVVATSQNPDAYEPVFWPQRGEYANLTNFATADDASLRLLYVVWPDDTRSGSIDEIALLSDGLQPLALQYQDQTAFAPFFRPILTRLRAESAGHSPTVSGLLASSLGSSRVNERTDDDKTLVVATHRPGVVSAIAAPPAPARSEDSEDKARSASGESAE